MKLRELIKSYLINICEVCNLVLDNVKLFYQVMFSVFDIDLYVLVRLLVYLMWLIIFINVRVQFNLFLCKSKVDLYVICIDRVDFMIFRIEQLRE